MIPYHDYNFISLLANDEHLLHGLVCHPYVFFSEMSLHSFCLFPNWIAPNCVTASIWRRIGLMAKADGVLEEQGTWVVAALSGRS